MLCKSVLVHAKIPDDFIPLGVSLAAVAVSGESGREARECDYEWVLDIRRQCVDATRTFWFKITGSLFRRDGIVQKVNPYKQGSLAKELGIDIIGDKKLF
jgi:hypothetical protein